MTTPAADPSLQPSWKTSIQHAAQSDIGMRRQNNQDAMVVVAAASEGQWLERGHFFMVADGMGAHAAGELASEMATETVHLTYDKLRTESPALALRNAIIEANRKIHERGQAEADFQGMGTTASVLVLLPQGAIAAHVGDSRVYRLRGNQLEQLTFDHSLVWEMMAASGKRDEKEVPGFIPKNVITRSLGPNQEVKVDLEGPFPLSVGDRFLLCSDGLSGPVKDEELAAILASLSPAEACQALVDLANLRGGPDNITCIIVHVTGQAATSAEIEPLPPLPDELPSGGAWLGAKGIAAAALAGFIVVTLAMLLLGQWIVATGSAVLSIGALGYLRWKFGWGRQDKFVDNVRYGRGPHLAQTCPPGDMFAASLGELVAELREAAMNKDWVIDWHTFDGHCGQAKNADEPATAIRHYCRAISFMMRQVRQQRGKQRGE